MTSSSERLLTLKSRLAEAELAEHQVAIGGRKVQITTSMPNTGTQSASFSPANLPALQAYIARLKGEIADLSGDGAGVSRAFYWA